MLQPESVCHEYGAVSHHENYHHQQSDLPSQQPTGGFLLSKCYDTVNDYIVGKQDLDNSREDDFADGIDYKQRYRQLKADFVKTVEEHEYIKCELRHYQQQLQVLKEDKFFLLERIMHYEKAPDSPESPDLCSDSDTELSSAATKKAKLDQGGVIFASAFSKVKSFSVSRKPRKAAKTKCPEDVVVSPSDSIGQPGDSVGPFDDEQSVISSVGFNFPSQEESE